jgi:hypothetical protein
MAIRRVKNAVLVAGRKDFEERDRVAAILCLDGLSPGGALLLQPACAAQY